MTFKGRVVGLGLGEQVDGSNPAHQRQFDRLKKRSAGSRGLLPEGRTLPAFQSFALERAMAGLRRTSWRIWLDSLAVPSLRDSRFDSRVHIESSQNLRIAAPLGAIQSDVS